MEELLRHLQVAAEDAADVMRCLPPLEKRRELRALLEPCLANRDERPEPPASQVEDPLFSVHVILAGMDAIRQCHREFGIPDEMSWATLAHLGRAMAAYRAEHGRAGIALGRWDWLRYFGWLYQSGRLEVTPLLIRKHPKQAGPLFWYDDATAAQLGPGFRVGDPAVSLHVPASGPLTPQECDEALRGLKEAFARRYAAPPRIAVCTSWLLDEQLAQYLPADSNIVAFQRRFQLVEGAREGDDAVLHFVFGADRAGSLDGLPQRTTLERAVAGHLRQGRHWQMRTGWLELAG